MSDDTTEIVSGINASGKRNLSPAVFIVASLRLPPAADEACRPPAVKVIYATLQTFILRQWTGIGAQMECCCPLFSWVVISSQ